MIKMYIGGEEVVCNKEFTIKEEMLSTSSTILNNCYPKSWEQDHDYTSRFYYPKDYSQCLIYNDISIVPKGYTQVSYIKSTGTQYIDTGRKTTPNTKISFKFSSSKASTSSSPHYLFGAQVPFQTENVIYGLIGSSNYIQLEFPHSTSETLTMTTTGEFGNTNQVVISPNTPYIYIYDLPNRSMTVGEYTCTSTDTYDITPSDYNIYLFNRNRGIKPTSNFAIGELYSFKWYENNNLVMNLIPCVRDSDEEVGLYDTISNTFFENKGTGSFVAGEVNPEIEQTLIFAGMVKNSGNISLNPRYPKYCALEILDFKDFLSTGEYLDFVISNKTVLEAIQMVVNAVSQYGFVLGNVNILGGNDIIGAYSTQEKSAYDVFQYLADITGSRWTTRMIDENTVAIDFYDPTLMPQGQDIKYTKSWWETNQVNDLVFYYGTRDYRNKQVMLSSQVYGGANYNETILGDGYNKNFNTSERIGLIKAIYVNGTEVSFATNVDKELGIETDFYYTPGENVISSNESQPSYSAGTQIAVNYTPLVKGREVVYNTDEINRINTQLGRKGVVERYEQRNDVLYTEDLEKIGQSYIKYKGSAEVILTLTTQVDIYNVGEVVYFNAPINDLAQNYMVKKKSTQIIVTGDFSNVWYTYELTSSFNSETALNWFDNQRNKTNGNISEGEYITRNIDIENTANIIWDNLTITEVTPSGDNVLNSVLNSPFTK